MHLLHAEQRWPAMAFLWQSTHVVLPSRLAAHTVLPWVRMHLVVQPRRCGRSGCSAMIQAATGNLRSAPCSCGLAWVQHGAWALQA